VWSEQHCAGQSDIVQVGGGQKDARRSLTLKRCNRAIYWPDLSRTLHLGLEHIILESKVPQSDRQMSRKSGWALSKSSAAPLGDSPSMGDEIMYYEASSNGSVGSARQHREASTYRGLGLWLACGDRLPRYRMV
jgi:hypothetical protein